MPTRTKSVQTVKSRNKSRSGTVASLADVLVASGADSVDALLRAQAGEARPPYHIVRPLDATPSARTTVGEGDKITYRSFAPPFELPYIILHATFEPGEKDHFMSHLGEEVLIPTSGRVRYHFLLHPTDRRTEKVSVGEAIRINPQVPHHTWADGHTRATAWMVFRHESGVASAIMRPLHSDRTARSHVQDPRRDTADGLSDPARFALIAFGIAERIRLHRERAQLTMSDLASLCDVDTSHLSRIENGESNPSLDMLRKIAAALRVDLDELIVVPKWYFDRERPNFGARAWNHVLHAHASHVQIASAAFTSEETVLDVSAVRPSSWICLEGPLLVGNDDLGFQVLDAGGVMHLRPPGGGGELKLRVKAVRAPKGIVLRVSAKL